MEYSAEVFRIYILVLPIRIAPLNCLDSAPLPPSDAERCVFLSLLITSHAAHLPPSLATDGPRAPIRPHLSYSNFHLQVFLQWAANGLNSVLLASWGEFFNCACANIPHCRLWPIWILLRGRWVEENVVTWILPSSKSSNTNSYLQNKVCLTLSK